MDAATTTSLITLLVALLTGLGTYLTSARKSELEALREAIAIQDRTIEALQVDLARERQARKDAEAEVERLRQQSNAELQRLRQESDEQIRQLKARIEELEGVDKRRRRGMAGRPPDDRGLG